MEFGRDVGSVDVSGLDSGTFLIILAGIVIAWMVYAYIAKPVGGPVQYISKRCPGCSIHPMPKDMAEHFGEEWVAQVYCTKCREKRMSQNRVFVAIVPKLIGVVPSAIKEWFIPPGLRKACKEKNYSYLHGTNTTVYLSDGYRFWRWSDIPWNMEKFQTYDTFSADHQTWEILADAPVKVGVVNIL